jgi:hypothetical protein
MPKIQNVLQKRNLAQYQTWTVDTNPTSRYFRLSQIPEVLTGGKNAFLIAGSPELIGTTEVLLEITDADGNTIFLQPIKNYAEGLSRLVSVEIYQDTAPGLATLTILGEISRDADGNPVPAEWASKYNVKWQKQILVAPEKPNTTTIRLYQKPVLSITELLVPYRNALTGSTLTLTTASVGVSSVVSADPTTGPVTVIQAQGFPFIRDYLGGTFAATINGQAYSASISTIYNNGNAQLDPAFTGTLPLGFSTPNYSITYDAPASFAVTALSRSFVDVRLSNLTTFAGDIARAKFYLRSLDQPGDYQHLTDLQLEATELTLTQSSATGQQDVEMGVFFNQSVIDSYWQAGTFTFPNNLPTYVTGSATASYDTTILLDALRLKGINVTSPSAPRGWVGLQNPLTFSAGLEYTFTGSFYGSFTGSSAAQMDVYLVGAAFPSTSVSPLGQRIGSYVLPVGYGAQRWDGVSFNFTAPNDGAAYLRFVVNNGDWYFSEISIFSANESGFNPDEVRALAPVIGRRAEHLQFKAELYDVNSNLVPILIESDPIYFDGGNYVFKGTDHRIEGAISVIGSGSNPSTAIKLQATGFTKGATFMSGSAMIIGSGSFFNANTPFLVGSTVDGSPFISIADKLEGYVDPTTGQFILNIVGSLLVNSGSDSFDMRSLLARGVSDVFYDRVRGGQAKFQENRGYRAVTAGDWNSQIARMGYYTRGTDGFNLQSPVSIQGVSGSINPFVTGSFTLRTSGSIFVPSGSMFHNNLIFGDMTVAISDTLIQGSIYLMTYQLSVASNWNSYPSTGSAGQVLVAANQVYVATKGSYGPDPIVKYPIIVPEYAGGEGGNTLYYMINLTVTATPTV